MNYAYRIEASAISVNIKSPLNLTGMIRNLEIVGDYDRSVFPLIRFNLNLTGDIYSYIEQDKDIKFSITVKKFLQEDLEANRTNIFTYFIKDELFIPIDKERTPINNQDGLEANNLSVPSIPVAYMLMNEKSLANNKKMVNTVLSDTDMEGAILYLAHKFTDKPVIFETPSNQKLYKQIIFPPNNIIRSLKYLNTVYGIYNYGLRLYFDLNAYFIINKVSNKNIGIVENDHKNVYINIVGDSSEELMYTQNELDSDGNATYYSTKLHINDMKFINYEDSKKEFIGTNNIVVSQGETSLIRKDYTEDITKTRVFYNRYINSFKEHETIVGGKFGFFMVCTVDAIDIDAVSCNHQFFVTFKNKNYAEYSGEYHILKSENNFVVGTTGNSALQTKLYFRKIITQ